MAVILALGQIKYQMYTQDTTTLLTTYTTLQLLLEF